MTIESQKYYTENIKIAGNSGKKKSTAIEPREHYFDKIRTKIHSDKDFRNKLLDFWEKVTTDVAKIKNNVQSTFLAGGVEETFLKLIVPKQIEYTAKKRFTQRLKNEYDIDISKYDDNTEKYKNSSNKVKAVHAAIHFSSIAFLVALPFAFFIIAEVNFFLTLTAAMIGVISGILGGDVLEGHSSHDQNSKQAIYDAVDKYMDNLVYEMVQEEQNKQIAQQQNKINTLENKVDALLQNDQPKSHLESLQNSDKNFSDKISKRNHLEFTKAPYKNYSDKISKQNQEVNNSIASTVF